MSKKAVIVGCDYMEARKLPAGSATAQQGQQIPNQAAFGCFGAVNDAHLNAELLAKRFGFHEASVLFLTDRDRSGGNGGTNLNQGNPIKDEMRVPTKINILRSLSWLVETSLPGDILFFSFSGLGTQALDMSGIEEDGMHEGVLPADFTSTDFDGFPYRVVWDFEVRAILNRVNPQAQLTLLLDCNHAGTFLDVDQKLDGTTRRVVPLRKPRGFQARTRDPRSWASGDMTRDYRAPRFLPALSIGKHLPPGVANRVGSTFPDFQSGFAFCAARDDQAALEANFDPIQRSAQLPNGVVYGVLTYAFHMALQNLQYNTSYEQCWERMNDYMDMMRSERFAASAQHIQLSYAHGVDPAEEKLLGVPSQAHEQAFFQRSPFMPATRPSTAVNMSLRSMRALV